MMGRRLVIYVFALIAAAVAAQAIEAVGNATADGALGPWLVAVYAVLKLAVAIAFTAFVVIRGPALRRSRKPVAYLVCAAVLVPALLGEPSESASPALMVGGELVAVLGCAWMLVAALALGRCFGVLPEARGLVTHGPYAVVRHPLYLGELAAMTGLLIASPSARNLGAGAAFLLAQFMRMRLEESALTAEFPEYADYAARTPRIVPSPPRFLRPGPALRPAGEGGQAMVEYAIILGAVAAVVFVVLTPLGDAVVELIDPVAGRL
jgi:protein-S-isoprenylcysteine O-methyltransferase Ste14/Flp pilus assembly pilin Flp